MSEVTKAIKQICDEKGLNYEVVLDALQAAMAAAYRKDYGNKMQNIEVKFDPDTGAMQVWDVKEVAEDMDLEKVQTDFDVWVARKEAAEAKGEAFTEEEPVRFNGKVQILLTEARAINSEINVGETLRQELPVPGDFGRMAAQTAKQVIMQKLREAERQTTFDAFKGQEGEIIVGTVQRREGRGVIIDLGKVSGFIPPAEQIFSERYIPGARIKVLLLSVALGQRGPEIILSRANSGVVRQIFTTEIPEIANDTVEIKAIARDAGFRSKVAVATTDDSIDPIGACIGQRGSRIQTIIAELGGEKVDIIQYDEDTETFLSNAMAPAKVNRVILDEDNHEATVYVNEDQFSLAIGRGGQNVRLAAELIGWKVKVVQEGGEAKEVSSDGGEADVKPAADEPAAAPVLEEKQAA
ncbi:MAG TPA: transcription termination/antitermination protein NusA [Candidatus Magasanikbacteria bacterium]|nr:transcription termination/antitermination protein NusA [Candidatus Magasanikbacteria bacterium]